MIGLEVNNYTQLKKQIHDLRAKLHHIRSHQIKVNQTRTFEKHSQNKLI